MFFHLNILKCVLIFCLNINLSEFTRPLIHIFRKSSLRPGVPLNLCGIGL